MNLTLEAIGLTQEEAQERVISVLVDNFLRGSVVDEEGNEIVVASQFQKSIKEAILTRVDETMQRLVAPVLEYSITDYISNFKIEHTNTYGEKKRDPETITEYIVRRAWEYLTEGVDGNGKGKGEYGRNDYSGDKTTRVAYLIDKRLSEEIEKAMKEALKTANDAITGGLKSAVAFELNKLNAKLKS